MEGVQQDDNDGLRRGGRLPLSAKLAAYGESLALERQLKRVEEGKDDDDSRCCGGREGSVSPMFTRDVGWKSGTSSS